MLKNWMCSLSARIWLTSIVLLAISLTAMSAAVIFSFERFPSRTLGRHEQSLYANGVAHGIQFNAAGRPISVHLPDEDAWLIELVPNDLKYRVLDAQGKILLRSDLSLDDTPWTTDKLDLTAGKFERVLIGARPYYLSTLQVRHGSDIFYAQAATSARLSAVIVDQKVRAIPKSVNITFLTATLIFGLTLMLAAHRVMKPLREVSRAAARISPRNLAARLASDGVPSEIKPLIDGFNAALERIENGYLVQQQFLAAAAHELQTPLTLIRGQIELQPEIKNQDLLFREIDLMSRQVRQLLHLAEVSEAQNFTFALVDSVEVVQEVAEYLRRKADQKSVLLQVAVKLAPAPIWADRSALFILLKNIVENAVHVSQAHSTVTVIVDGASIEIRDQGPGIQQEYLPFLFKRFWRAPGAKHDGAGLGLAICKEIAMAHEWRLTVSNLVSGARFVLWL